MVTYYEMETDDAAVSWRLIRNLRANPSPNLSKVLKQNRAKVFHAALEQSQQQFVAASSIGFDSRPLNLFYGLAQAGRAIGAASAELGQHTGDAARNTWLPGGGHGIKFGTVLDQSVGLLGSEVQSNVNSSDSFSRISFALKSPTDFTAITMGALLSQIPEIRMNFPTLLPGPFDASPGSATYMAVDQDNLKTGFWLPEFFPDSSTPVSEVKARLNLYPMLNGLDVETDLNGNLLLDHNGHILLIVPKTRLVSGQHGQFDIAGTGLYRGHRYAAPAAGISSKSLHPLATWWLTLFALSMLARYSPSDWSEVLTIRTSKIASLLEFTLELALDSVPQLIAETFDSLNR